MAFDALSLSLFSGGSNSSSNSSSSIVPLDISSLMTANTPQVSVKKTIQKLTPWDSSLPKTDADKLANEALNTTSLFSGGLGKGAGSQAKDKNDRELFLIHNAVAKLKAIADVAATKSLTEAQKQKFNERITKGLAEIEAHTNKVNLTGATLLSGHRYSTIRSENIGFTAPKTHLTAPLVTGSASQVPPQFEGDIKFQINVKTDNGETLIDIDLTTLPLADRNVQNVASLINSKLAENNIESRFSRDEIVTKSTIKNMPDTLQQRLKITFGAGETLSFNDITSNNETAIYVSGVATKDSVSQSLITRLDLSQNNEINQASTKDIIAKNGAQIRAMARDDDGSIYVVTDINGDYSGLTPKNNKDVALQKIDSTGRVEWSRALGSAAPANGFSIAIDVDGTIAVAGAVDGKINSSSAISGNGIDSFVAAFDENGKDLWTYQKGSAGTDKAIDIAFDNDGNLLLLGQTNDAIDGEITNGGEDVYVQSLDIDGNLNYTKIIGNSGNDAPISIEINNNQAMIAWNEGDIGHISRIDSATGNFASADILASNINLGKISKFGLDDNGNAIIAGNSLGGGDSADNLIALNLVNNSIIFSKNFSGNPINAINIEGTNVNIALEGQTSSSAANPNAVQTLIKGISISDGVEIFSKAVAGEAKGPISIISAQNQSKSLQALGLPQGELKFDSATALTDLTTIQDGDFFYISVNNGTKRKITLSQGETMQSLSDKINRFSARYATASVLSNNGAKYLSISPKANNKIELFEGSANMDALSQLGIDTGVIMAAPSKTAKSKAPPVIALELPKSINVSDKTKAKSLVDSLDAVLRRIRSGYRDISTDPTMVELRKNLSGANKSTSTNSAAIAAYNNQTASFQAALARLTGQ